MHDSFTFISTRGKNVLGGAHPGAHTSCATTVTGSPQPIVDRRAKRFRVCPSCGRLRGCANMLRPCGLRVFHSQLGRGKLRGRVSTFRRTANHFTIRYCGTSVRCNLHATNLNKFRVLSLRSFPKRNSTLMNVLSTFVSDGNVIAPRAFHNFYTPIMPLTLVSACYCDGGRRLGVKLTLAGCRRRP